MYLTCWKIMRYGLTSYIQICIISRNIIGLYYIKLYRSKHVGVDLLGVCVFSFFSLNLLKKYLRYGFGVKWVLLAVSSICPNLTSVYWVSGWAWRNHFSPLCIALTKCQFSVARNSLYFPFSSPRHKNKWFLGLGWRYSQFWQKKNFFSTKKIEANKINFIFMEK